MRNAKFWDWYDDEVVPRLGGVNNKHRANRTNTFRLMFEHLDSFDRPVTIIETGCISDIETVGAWLGNGCSTHLFDKYCDFRADDSYCRSVDIIPERVADAQKLMGCHTEISCDDSVGFLNNLALKGISPDLLYLDASHLYWHLSTIAQVHHYNELMAIMPTLRPDTMVVVDDSPAVIDEQTRMKIEGKGGLVAQYAKEVGAELVFSEYQSGWMGFPGHAELEKKHEANDEMIGRARAYVEGGNWYEAYELYRTLMVRTPVPWSPRDRIVHGEACAFFARLCMNYHKRGSALDWFNQAIGADPYATDYRIEMVNKILLPMGLHTAAVTQAAVAAQLAPDDPLTWRSLGQAEGAAGNMEESIAAHEKQIELSKRDSVALMECIVTLIDMERYPQALDLANEMLAKEQDTPGPMLGNAYHCLAMIAARCDKHERAIPLFHKALECKCNDPTLTEFHLSLSLHSIGRYREGWEYHAKREHNTSSVPLFMPLRRFARPLFSLGASCGNRHRQTIVHVHNEAGAGDNIATWRYLPILLEQGYEVHYESRPELLKLAKDSLRGVTVLPNALDYPGAAGLKDFDYHIPVGELPRIFGTDIDTVPWHGPYVKADKVLTNGFVAMDPPLMDSHRTLIGIAWSAGVREESGAWLKRYGQLKSVGFANVEPIIDFGEVNMCGFPGEFVSLQVGPPRAENQNRIVDLLPNNPSWADSAALIDKLDIVITPDTGLAHLAGAMGKPTFLMMHNHNSGWHFMCERPGAKWNRRSPWYPSMLIYRGRDWATVVTHIINDLRTGKWKEELQTWPWDHAKADLETVR